MKQFIALFAAALFAVPAFAQTPSIHSFAGVPVSGTTEVQTLTIQTSTSGGTFKITIASGAETTAITWTATDATLVARVDAALEALSQIGTGGVTTAAGTLSSGIGTITLTFAGKNAKRDMPALSVSSNAITGGATPAIATTTPGVDSTLRDKGVRTGDLLIDTVTPDLYIQDSTTPLNGLTWTKVSP